jgi:Mn2+/Fe2+ NRAMP family transporter
MAMFSTTLAVVDIYPRVMMELAKSHVRFKLKTELNPPKAKLIYWLFLFLVPIVALVIINFFKGGFTHLVDFAVALSFISSPVIGYYNLKLMSSKHMPELSRPKKGYIQLSWSFLIFLIMFSMVFVYWSYIK